MVNSSNSHKIQQLVINQPQSQHITFQNSLNQNHMQSTERSQKAKFEDKSTIVNTQYVTSD